MRQQKRWIRSLALCTILTLGVAACGGSDSGSGDDATTTEGETQTEAGEGETEAADNGDQEELNLTMGGSQSSSSVFAFVTAQARLAGEADGALTINVRETGASSENIQLVEDASVDFGLSGLSTVISAHRGIGSFEGNESPNICNLMNYLVNAEYITVRADAGIDVPQDLDGEPFAPSFQGSALYDNILAYLEVFDVEPDTFDGSLEDIVNAMKDGRIVGFGKSANGFGADASMLDVSSAVDVKAIGWTQEDVDQILADDPDNEAIYQFAEVEPGTIYDNDESFLTSVVVAAYFTSTETMDEDVQYRTTKALWDAIDQAAEETNYAGAMDRSPEETTDTAEKMPLCPGAERYYEEVGAL